jgi:dienelactone hydrolase
MLAMTTLQPNVHRPASARTLAGVPLLIAEPAPGSEPVPVVLWYHGFRADALAHAGELERCAAAGFLAVGVDAVGHGARRDLFLDQRVARSADGGLPIMLEIVENTVREFPALIDALADSYPVDRERISIVGISMGAFLVYRAVALGSPVRAAVALLGSPEWPNESSPHHQLDAFRTPALLSITAERDTRVPGEAAMRLHSALGVSSPSSDADIGVARRSHHHHHYILRGAGHLTSADEWARAMRVTQQWLGRNGR